MNNLLRTRHKAASPERPTEITTTPPQPCCQQSFCRRTQMSPPLWSCCQHRLGLVIASARPSNPNVPAIARSPTPRGKLLRCFTTILGVARIRANPLPFLHLSKNTLVRNGDLCRWLKRPVSNSGQARIVACPPRPSTSSSLAGFKLRARAQQGVDQGQPQPSQASVRISNRLSSRFSAKLGQR